MRDPQLAFIGAGNMAASIIGGLVARGTPATRIVASDPSEDSRARLRAVASVRTEGDNQTAIEAADVVILAVKPQVMQAVLAPLADSLRQRRPLIVSIAAGITTVHLEQWLGASLPIVRCMPNTPALVGAGATVLFASPAVSPGQRRLAESILGAVGLTAWVDAEAQMDAVTALSGSGPAYFFLVMEAMQAAAEALGLPAALARSLTLQTALGAARMAAESDHDPATLRRQVTSPGGTTEQALARFEAGGLRELFQDALAAACERSRELARDMD